MRFGLLSYSTRNLGDEIQSIAAQQFLPSVDEYIDRDYLSEYRSFDGNPTALICNGWFSHRPENWPPSPDIVPLFISIHLTEIVDESSAGLRPKELWLADGVADYFKRWSPVGARDLHTLNSLEEAGVDAYFSGCLSLTLKPADSPRWGDYVVAVDVPEEALDYLLRQSTKTVVVASHDRERSKGRQARFQEAQELLNLYQNASAVVTTLLHCAMPCLALQTPVYLIDVQQDQYRFSGLNRLVRHGSVKDFVEGGFDVNYPESNSDDYRVLGALLEERIMEFVANVSKGFASQPPMNGRSMEQARYRTLLEIHCRTVQENRDLKRNTRFPRLSAHLTSCKRIIAGWKKSVKWLLDIARPS
jgi:Polysaccharide pyruvyl transferase